MTFLLNFLGLLCEVLTIAIFARAMISWISPGSTTILVHVLYQVTEPLLAPLRRVVPRVGMLDFSPMVAILILQLIRYLLL